MFFSWGKERESDFGKMFGVESHSYVSFSLLSMEAEIFKAPK